MIGARLGAALMAAAMSVAGQVGAGATARAEASAPSGAGPLAAARPHNDAEGTPQATTPRPSTPRVRFPTVGSRRYRVAPAGEAAIGTRGRVLRYRVVVERDIANVDAAVVADLVEQTLADPRGWTAGGKWRFLRVGPGQRHHFTVYLATPATRDALCNMGFDRYTSCRNGRRVVLNVARWTRGIPRYRAPLDTYRRYMINHEIGHFLGHGHELCPGRGRPAPVMLQQTFGLHGCVANPWPYLEGRRYRGPAGAYF